jgi:hypothetical protein
MRRFFVNLGLLTLLTAIHAGELPVIDDSEAVGYVGKSVEVRGLVVSVRSSPLGTAFINFGRDYPNQTFAGFIAAGSGIATDQRIAMLEGKIIGIAGTIELYRGKPEIAVTSMIQIKGADSESATINLTYCLPRGSKESPRSAWHPHRSDRAWPSRWPRLLLNPWNLFSIMSHSSIRPNESLGLETVH